MYQKLNKLKKHHQLLYSLIISIGIVAIWRGLWMILDTVLFPTNVWLSVSSSILFGIIIITITHYKLN